MITDVPILVSYCVSKEVEKDFLKSQVFQPDLPNNFYRVAFTDAYLEMPKSVAAFRSDFSGHGLSFNLARQRNILLDFAIERSYEWVIILDCDSVIVDFNSLPASGYGTANIWFQGENEPIWNMNRFELERWKLCSWFILRRDIFTQPWCRFDESYKGVYHEDLDFHEHVLIKNGVERTPCDVRCIHIWHPHRGGWLKENEDRFLGKRVATEAERIAKT